MSQRKKGNIRKSEAIAMQKSEAIVIKKFLELNV